MKVELGHFWSENVAFRMGEGGEIVACVIERRAIHQFHHVFEILTEESRTATRPST